MWSRENVSILLEIEQDISSRHSEPAIPAADGGNVG